MIIKDFISDNLVELHLGETLTTHFQYMVDIDYFKITIQQAESYEFEFSRINNDIFSMKHSENLLESIHINPGIIALDLGI